MYVGKSLNITWIERPMQEKEAQRLKPCVGKTKDMETNSAPNVNENL